MIVPMKKLHLIVQKKDIVPALSSLCDLGIVHVEHQEELSGYQLEERREEVAMLKEALEILARFECKLQVPQKEAHDWTDVVTDIQKLYAEIEHHQESIAQRSGEIRQWDPWGDFNPKDIAALATRGIYVQLCEAPAKGKADVPAGVVLEEISVSSGVRRCLAISDTRVDLPFPVIAPPSLGLYQMKNLQIEDEARIRQAREKITELRCYENAFQRILVERENVLQFEEVQKGMREDQDLALLKGYCPIDACAGLTAKAKQEQWGVFLEDPSPEDTVPTLLKNPKAVSIINPIFELMSIVPGYKEKDISPFFLVFFSIFFGMLVGDAGYGMIFLVLTAVFHKLTAAKVSDKSFFYLSYVLSSVTIVWGLLTGTFFGTLLFGQTFKPLLPWLSDIKNVQFLCFVLGITHLTIAHLWRCVTRGALIGALAEVGWILMLWGSFFLANMMLLGMPLPAFVPYLYMAGAALVIMDIIAQRNDIGVNMILFVFSVINTFGDIVSYIRLFAVGLAGVAVADAFNQMALGIGFGNVFAGFAAVLILAFVHLFLNLALCVMGVLVHGVRLNVLEFSGHLGMEWSGIKYNPFKKVSITT